MRVRKKGLVILTIFSVMAWILTQNNLLLFLVFFAVTRWIDLFLVLRNIPKLKVERYITKTRLFVDEKARMVFKIINTGNMKLFLKLQPSLSPVRFFKEEGRRTFLVLESSHQDRVPEKRKGNGGEGKGSDKKSRTGKGDVRESLFASIR